MTIKNNILKAFPSIPFILVSSILFIMSPLLSLPVIFYGIYHRKKEAFVLLACFIGILAYLSVPSEDLFRHYTTYLFWKARPYDSIKWIYYATNGIFVYIYWFMSHYGIPFDFLRLVQLPVAFILLCNVFNYMIIHSNRQYTKKEAFVRFLIFLFFFDFIYTTMGVRYGFALSLYIYSLHLLANKRNKWGGLITFFIAANFHIALAGFGIIVFVLYSLRINRKTALVMIFFIYILLSLFLTQYGEALLGARFKWYFSSKAVAATQYSAMTLSGLFLYILPKLTALSFLYINIKYYDKKSRWARFSLAWGLFSMAMIPNAVTFYRSWWVFMAIGIYMLLDTEKKRHIPVRDIHILLANGILFVCLNALTYHKEIAHSPYYKSILPVPYILSEYYDQKWYNQNINFSTGNFKH